MVYRIVNRPPATETPAPVTTTASKPPSTAPTRPNLPNTKAPPPVRGLIAQLPEDPAPLFGADAALGNDFAQARSDLAGGKSPMAVRQKLELRTRDGDAATGHLDTLLQQFPKSSYGPVARAMQIEAQLFQATPKEKGVKADPKAMQAVIDKAEALFKQESSPEVKAYSRFIVASAYDIMDQNDKASANYMEVAENYPETAQAVSSLIRGAKAQQQLGQIDTAVASLERMIKTYPNDEATREGMKMLRELRLIGKPAPELKALTWPKGQQTSMAELKGKVVLVNFWQTWCPHCKEELPHLSELYQKYRDRGFVIIGCTRDDNRQNEQQLTDFLESNPLPFPIARVDPQSSRDYAVSGIPAAALVDRSGIIRWRAHPNSLPIDQLEALLAQK
jgi:thiol-disulfide isomerase/thioredoxin